MIVTDGLIAYWHSKQGVDEDNYIWHNIAPNTIGNYDGELYGTELDDKGIYLDSSFGAYVDFELPQSVQEYGTSVTFEFKMNMNNLDAFPDIVSDESGASMIYVGANEFWLVIDFDTFNIWHDFYAEEEHYISIVYDANFFSKPETAYVAPLRVYINGEEVLTADLFSELVFTTPKIRFGSQFGYDPDGYIDSIRIYERALKSEEIMQNYLNGSAIGLEDDGGGEDPADPPGVDIVSVSEYELSNAITSSEVKFRFDQTVKQWTINAHGTGPQSGNVIGYGGQVTSGTVITAEVTKTGLFEGDNRINIYGQNEDNVWTEFEEV